MKLISILFFILLLSLHTNAQENKNETVLYEIEQKIVEQLRKECHQKLQKGQDSSAVLFYADTAYIERLLEGKLNLDFSTTGMVKSMHEAEEAYDHLLNKYYLILLHKFKLQDQETLKISQRNWLQFRNSEMKLSSLLSEDTYARGTIQRIIHAENCMERTKNRVIELFQYLIRIEIDKE